MYTVDSFVGQGYYVKGTRRRIVILTSSRRIHIQGSRQVSILDIKLSSIL